MSAACADATAATPARTSGPAAGARGARRGPAPGSDTEKKRVVAFGAAARLCGSDKVTMTPDGHFEMTFRHSKEQPLEIIEGLKDLIIKGLSFEQQQQQNWMNKVTAKAGAESSGAAAAAAEPSKRSRDRARRKANEKARRHTEAEAKAKAEAEAAELRARLAAAGMDTSVSAPAAETQPAAAGMDTEVSAPAAEAELELAQRVVDEVSQRAGVAAAARGVAVESRFAELEQGGEPRPIVLPAGTWGAASTPRIIGETVISAISGQPPEQLEAAVQNITTKLFALAEAPPFGGGGALEPQPFAGFGATPGFFGAGPSCVSASGGGGAPDRKFKQPSRRRG